MPYSLNFELGDSLATAGLGVTVLSKSRIFTWLTFGAGGGLPRLGRTDLVRLNADFLFCTEGLVGLICKGFGDSPASEIFDKIGSLVGTFGS